MVQSTSYVRFLIQKSHGQQHLACYDWNVRCWNSQTAPRSGSMPRPLKTCSKKQIPPPTLNRSNAYLRKPVYSMAATICLKNSTQNGQPHVARHSDVAGWASYSTWPTCVPHEAHWLAPSNPLTASSLLILLTKLLYDGSCCSSHSLIDAVKPYKSITDLPRCFNASTRAIRYLRHPNSTKRCDKDTRMPFRKSKLPFSKLKPSPFLT